MKISSSFGFVISWRVALFAGVLLSVAAAPQSVRIEQKDGLTVVRNGSKPAAIPGAPKGVRLVHELTIGSENDADETMIFTIRAVQAGAGGEVYVLDGKIGQVKIYGPDGRHLRTIGKKGQGPGELQSPTRMTMTPYFAPHKSVLYYFILDDEGRFYVRTYDTDENGRFYYDVFDREGRYFTRLSLPESELLWVVKKGKAYTYIEENEDGIPQVKRYAVVWE